MHHENQVQLFFLNYFIQEHFKKEEEKGNCQNNRIDLVLQLHFITRGDGDVKKPNHTRTRTVGYLGYHGSRIGWRKWPHIIAYGSSFSSFLMEKTATQLWHQCFILSLYIQLYCADFHCLPYTFFEVKRHSWLSLLFSLWLLPSLQSCPLWRLCKEKFVFHFFVA